jgi:hypothetical protein
MQHGLELIAKSVTAIHRNHSPDDAASAIRGNGGTLPHYDVLMNARYAAL